MTSWFYAWLVLLIVFPFDTTSNYLPLNLFINCFASSRPGLQGLKNLNGRQNSRLDPDSPKFVCHSCQMVKILPLQYCFIFIVRSTARLPPRLVSLCLCLLLLSVICVASFKLLPHSKKATSGKGLEFRQIHKGKH